MFFVFSVFPLLCHRLADRVVSIDLLTRNRRFGLLVAICLGFTWTASVQALTEEKTIRIVAIGDSLTAAYRLASTDAFPAKLERALKDRGRSVEIVNAGVSGDTAAMGLARLGRSINNATDAVILELGANDMLKGFEPNVTRAALEDILNKLEARGVAVLLCGVRTQPSRGSAYQSSFAAMFADLSREHRALFYPAFDEAFVDNPELKQSDGLHPTAAGIEAVVVRILPLVDELIDRARRMGRPKP